MNGALPVSQKDKACCKCTRVNIVRHNFNHMHLLINQHKVCTLQWSNSLQSFHLLTLKITKYGSKIFLVYITVDLSKFPLLAYSLRLTHSLPCSSADLLVWRRFTERLPKIKYESISNYDVKLSTYIPVLSNDHCINWLGVRFAIHCKLKTVNEMNVNCIACYYLIVNPLILLRSMVRQTPAKPIGDLAWS